MLENTQEFIQDFYYNKLEFCGCGSPSDILYVIKNILNVIEKKLKDCDAKIDNRYEVYQENLKNSLNQKDDSMEEEFSTNEGIVQIIYNVLTNVDVLEHGSSIGGSWLTDYGKELLKHLNSCNDDELEDILN